MNKEEIQKEYSRWKATIAESDLLEELDSLNEEQVHDAFYRDLEFGTGGLRGVIGVGTNRMNVHVVAKATQGLSDYINATFDAKDGLVAISRDSRIKSDIFAKVAAEVFAANGIKVMMYDDISPVPTLSYAVRYLHCCIGIMITASHNPSKYNGYKVYGSDGCQITTEAAKAIYSYIEKTDVLNGYKRMSFEEGLGRGLISSIPSKVIDSYVDEVKNQSLLDGQDVDKGISIVYSPLNGTGLKPITRVLKELGYTNVIVVKEQEQPDGNFPTCPYPNPEIKEALSLGLEYCRRYNADLMLATDPDCDRVGIAVKNKDGEYELLSGNEVGLLLFDYICSRRIALGKMPKNPVMVKTIVTMDLAERIAENYGVKTINVLTGFKFIGEQIGLLEKQGRESDYIFGFEESYGYLTGSYVRDKDGVNGATMICEMFTYYKSKGISLLYKLEDIWNKYGYCLNTLHSYEFNGESGSIKMKGIMDGLRSGPIDIPEFVVKKKLDYINGLDGLPKSNVIKLVGESDSIVFRPSGTEPKLKLYLSICSENKELAQLREKTIVEAVEKYFTNSTHPPAHSNYGSGGMGMEESW